MTIEFTIPGEARGNRRKKNTSANRLTQTVLAYLRLKGYMAWRQNNGGVYDPVRKIFRSNSSMKGVADIIAIKDGKCYMIEVKAGKDKLSDHQKLFADNWIKYGGYYLVINEKSKFEEWL